MIEVIDNFLFGLSCFVFLICCFGGAALVVTGALVACAGMFGDANLNAWQIAYPFLAIPVGITSFGWAVK